MEYTTDNASSLSLFVFMLLTILNCICINIIILKDLYLTFCQVPRVFLYLWRVWVERKSSRVEVATKKLCVDRNLNQKLEPQEVEMLMEKPVAAFTKKTCCHRKNLEEVSLEEVAMVMRQLGTCYDPEGEKLRDRLSSNDITALFEEQEPSLQEVREAFCMFDKNNDGFIDAKELRRVLCALCFAEVSETDCKRMIKAYDYNRDGVIDFNEFVRLLTTSLT
ncbi:hypothetical protein P3X46_023249 [Hevea brasiliensis]|uniref:EF-hand domain-containing protein n=1 Tax=Hevea brasiliensis TaxID=3981 RepID=A0ABQ9LC68_HEVBR|nr:probable calcium-binding protein CML45 [Hevea brasiliensis]KAJ9163599.1 hypothetical protein P3X46_023249 [Hevea brasiliensis]